MRPASFNLCTAVVATACVTLTAVTPAHGQLDPGDIVLRQDAFGDGTRIESGRADPLTGLPEFPQRVFIAELDPVTLFTNAPGFDSQSNAFAPGSLIGFDIMRALRVWDGNDFDAPAVPTLRVRFGGSQVFTPTPPNDGPTTGFSISVASDGAWHRHLGYTLQAPGEPGVYLLELQMWSSVPSISRSASIWLVMGNAASPQTLLDAADWVQAHLATPACPADFNGDAEVNPDDLGDYINCYFALPPCQAADVNGDGEVNPDDLGDYINLYFGTGC